ncbi:hypothetical protein LEMLEM_LOCUS21467 [Lemmus lemmus]
MKPRGAVTRFRLLTTDNQVEKLITEVLLRTSTAARCGGTSLNPSTLETKAGGAL